MLQSFQQLGLRRGRGNLADFLTQQETNQILGVCRRYRRSIKDLGTHLLVK